MMPVRSRLCLAFIVVVALLVVRMSPVRAANTASAPDLDMRDGHGRLVHLTDYRGKVLLVDLWASWCAPCEASFPALDALYREYRDRGLVVVAVNLDERRRNADAFLRRHPHEMLVVFDPRARVLKALGAPGIPSSYVIDRQGMIRHSHIGYAVDLVNNYRQELNSLFVESAR